MRGRPRKVVTNEECQKFNTLRREYSGKTLRRSEVEAIIKEIIGWKNSLLIEGIISKVFVRVERGVYIFPKEPIYIGKLQGLIDKLSKYRKTSYTKDRTEEVSVKTAIDAAIDLLKQNGFRITKESFNIEAALQHPEDPVSNFIVVTEF